ncbi:MAG: holo-ACP synthase [candidate division Zixibacteria bacterium]|nr:holo-ACP synthase [candidate division Zixibacteria bacterium]
MITAIGVDIVEVARIRHLMERYGSKFVSRVLGHEEMALLRTRRDAAQFVAGRFAAKEALIKAFGTYLTDRPAFPQIEILADGAGRPSVACRFPLSPALASVQMLVSISHEKSHAVAMAILSEEE